MPTSFSNKCLQISKNAALSSLLLGSIISTNAMAQTTEDGKWQVRVRALVVAPDSQASITPIGGTTDHTTQIVPELDISYFFSDHVSAELVLAVTKHDGTAIDTALGDVELGSVWLLPPTLTLQYHFSPDHSINPYVGAGVNYTTFFSEDLPDGSPLQSIEHDASFGFALQAGFDIKIDPDSSYFWNLDVKKVWMNTDVTIDAGTLGMVSADVDLDPWLIGVGVGRRF